MMKIKKIIASIRKKRSFNYFYFLLLFTFLISLNLRHFFSLPTPLSILFLLYALGQALFEVGSFVLILACLTGRSPRWVQFAFIGATFVLCLIHFTDFTLIRLMDAPISYLFKFLFYSGFLSVLQALNLNTSMIVITLCGVVLVPLAGPLIYWMTNFASRKKPIEVSLLQLGSVLSIIAISLFALDLIAYPFLNRPSYAQLKKTLPFKGTFFPPSPQCISLRAPLQGVRNEKETHSHFPELEAAHHPNIYLFVIETLRRDFINEETAPHLTCFAKENLSFVDTFANSSGTQTSWFAIFHSNYPYHWTGMRDSWTEGSIPLHLLKKLGYQIHVYSAADLSYFDMDRLIFGHERQLIDHVEEYSSRHDLKPYERDALAIDSFERDLGKEGGEKGNVYLFFLDSTHSEYSFPMTLPLKFQPIVSQIDYLTLREDQIEPIKNRYRNSISYLDGLIERFFSLLKQRGLYEDGVIAITGDHGEEFFEEGALFHGTHLNRYQTRVPIFCKMPLFKRSVQAEIVTHMDLFPSILHSLTGEERFENLFDGESIFSENRWPYRITVLQNGPKTPSEFEITQKDRHFRVRFLTQKIYEETKLELVDFEIREKISRETPLDQLIETHFPQAFKKLARPIEDPRQSEIEIDLKDNRRSGI